MKKIDLRGWVIPLLLGVIWYVVSTKQWVDPALLAPPMDVWHAFVSGWVSGELTENVLYSLLRNTTGFIVGSLVAIATGVALGLSRKLDLIFSPTLNAIKHVAVFAWIPLMIMWFGHGELSKIIFIALVVFYPVFFNAYDGVKHVPAQVLEVAQIYQLSPVQVFLKVILPSAAPSIFAGLNIALVYSWVATVGAEYFFVSSVGVVNPVMDGQNLFRMDIVLYGMAVIAVVGLIFSKTAQFFENYNLQRRQSANT